MSGHYRPDEPYLVGTPRVAATGSTAPQAPAPALTDAEVIARRHPPTKIVEPTITGPWHLDVGVRSYAIPEFSSVAHHEHEAIAYVRTPAGGIHVLTEHGELTRVSPVLLAEIRRTHFQT
ncbi:hypothetical protein [Microbacterium paulum]